MPRTNVDHAGHPAWASHLAMLRSAGVTVLDLAPTPPPPWSTLLAAVSDVLG